MFPSEWREFPTAPCLAGEKILITARVSMLLKSRASLTWFRACFLPGRAKDLSAPRYKVMLQTSVLRKQPDIKVVHYGVDTAGEHISPPAPYFIKQASHRLQKWGVPYFDLTVSPPFRFLIVRV